MAKAKEQGIAPWGDGNGTALDYGNYAGDKTTVSVKTTPVLHVVQNMSPEFTTYETGKPGDIMMRIGGKDNPNNPNLGTSFRGVVIARGKEYIWWGDKDEGEGVLARMKDGGEVPEGFDPNDLKWPSDGGNARKDGKGGPVADLTYTFIVCPYENGELGTPALTGYSRGAIKTGEQFNLLLNAFNGPDYAAVLEFTTVKHMGGAKKDQPYYVLTPKPVGQIMPEDTETLNTLKKYHGELKSLFA